MSSVVPRLPPRLRDWDETWLPLRWIDDGSCSGLQCVTSILGDGSRAMYFAGWISNILCSINLVVDVVALVFNRVTISHTQCNPVKCYTVQVTKSSCLLPLGKKSLLYQCISANPADPFCFCVEPVILWPARKKIEVVKWATLWQNQQNDLCAQQRLRAAWWSIGSSATHWAHSEDSDQTGRMPRLTWVFAGRTDHFVGFV